MSQIYNEVTDPPAVSVVIPTYNRAATLPRAVHSVLAQTFKNFELIIVDDGSSDNSQELIAAIDDPRIRYHVLEKNGGVSAARNAGVALARAEYVAFQDSDDLWLQDKLMSQYEAVAQSDVVGASYTSFILYDPSASSSNSLKRIPFSDGRRMSGKIFETLADDNTVSTQTLFVKKSLFEEVGGFDSRVNIGEDWDLALRLSKITEFAFISDPQVLVYNTPGSLLHSHRVNFARSKEVVLEKLDEDFRASKKHHTLHWYIVARTYAKCGEWARAKSAFYRALGRNPMSAKCYAGLALSIAHLKI
ncbi:MAG: glycosyltransferase family 2 protein [Methyloligellaceae bacterium]